MKQFFSLAGIFLLLVIGKSHAQDQSNVLHDENYEFKVKQIDDFIDRFNRDRFGNFYQYLKAENQELLDKKLNRAEFIRMLFNKSNSNLKPELIGKFINQVLKNKTRLRLTDSNWYAGVDCDFARKGTTIKIKIALEQQYLEDGSSKWVICGILSRDLDPLKNVDTTKFLNSSSHGTDFIGIERVFKDKDNLPAYFAGNFRPGSISVFIDEIKNNTLKFLQVNDVKYYFSQVSDWVFEVSQFHRDSKNSGWLISNLEARPDADKDIYLLRSLGIK